VIGPTAVVWESLCHLHRLLVNSRELCFLPLAFQDCEHRGIDAHCALGIFGLNVADHLPDNAALDRQRRIEPVHIGPFQGEAFADPKAE
jgi:hypothetical protein